MTHKCYIARKSISLECFNQTFSPSQTQSSRHLKTFAPCPVLIMDVLTIQSDEVALQAIKEITRPHYEKLWKDFKQFTGEDYLNFQVPGSVTHSELEDKVTGPNSSQLMAPQVV